MAALSRRERLRGRERLGELFEEGSRGFSGVVAARALENGLAYSRLAAVAGKKLGNAVMRNAMRRRLRAAFRTQKGELPAGFDLALIARTGLLEASWREITDGVRKAAAKAARGRDPGRPRPRSPM